MWCGPMGFSLGSLYVNMALITRLNTANDVFKNLRNEK